MELILKDKKKEFVDPALVSAVGGFAFKAILQAIVGYLSLEVFKPFWKWLTKSKREKDVSVNSTVPGEDKKSI